MFCRWMRRLFFVVMGYDEEFLGWCMVEFFSEGGEVLCGGVCVYFGGDFWSDMYVEVLSVVV